MRRRSGRREKRHRRPRTSLSAAVGTFIQPLVLPGLPAFLAAYPDLALHIDEGDRLVDPIREGVDYVLRVGNPQDSTMIGRKLADLDQADAGGHGPAIG